MQDRPLIYLAAPLFNELERGFNCGLAKSLSDHANVFLPQQDGELLVDLIHRGMRVEVAEQRVFHRDVQAIKAADLVVAVLDGAHVDEGVAFEIGFANGIGVSCVGLQTDVRRALPTGNNPMIARGVMRVFISTDDLVDWVRAWAREWDGPSRREHVA